MLLHDYITEEGLSSLYIFDDSLKLNIQQLLN